MMTVSLNVNMAHEIVVGILMVIIPMLITVGFCAFAPLAHKRKHGNSDSYDSEVWAYNFTNSKLGTLLFTTITMGIAWSCAWALMWGALAVVETLR